MTPPPAASLGPLEISEQARALLAPIWRRGASKTDAFTPVVVLDAEAALGTAIPNEVLAIALAEGRTLHDAIGMTDEVHSFYKTTNADVRFKLVAFARLGDDEAEPCYACFAPTTQRGGCELVEWDLRHPALPLGKPLSLAEYIERRWGAVAQDDSTSNPPFVPAIREAQKAAPLRVRHAKFGEGVLVQDHGDGKWTIRFDAHGERKLAKSFLTTVEPAPSR